jgi:ribosomal protein L31E
MKKLTILIMLLTLLGRVNAQQVAFQHGEKITYTVFYNVIGLYINAGTATFSTSVEQYNNNNVFHVVGEGATNSKYDWIFKVRDRYESYFNTNDLQSVKFIRNINEGSFKMHEEVAFNQQTNTAITSKGVYKVPERVQDVINAIYYARNIDYNTYKPGDKITFSMFLDNKVYNLYVKYIGKETVKTRYGKYNAIKLSPQVITGNVFKNDDKMLMWVTDDSNHIPVRVESPISVGSIKIDLKEYQNLKYPLTGIVKN